ncbi:glycosyltransferase [Rhodovastum atsumiense]|uniref:glycosyltransferase n=1 Tax=Rhodovastum atsumiense TaxID=504468 RepID=UPI002025AA92|nr:glycosyltransferase [Rhodovastum atsumiense]
MYYWIHHTGGYDGNTGVQRVVRGLADALLQRGCEIVPVCWCNEREAIVHAGRSQVEGLAQFGGPTLAAGPEEEEPIHLAAADHDRLDGAWLLLPEVPHVAGDVSPNPVVAFDYARYHGLRCAAIFYDLIPLRHAGYESLAGDHARYARALAGTDLVLAISAAAAQDLQRWWDEHDFDSARLPRVLPLPLPAEMTRVPRVTVPATPAASPVRFLSLGTLEPRKNQLNAMRAFARLCARRGDLDLRFDLVGAIHPAVAVDVHDIAAHETRIRLHGFLPDAEMRSLMEQCHATVFLSLMEGYGLPVAESLWLGKPCLCSDHGSVAEIAADGGCFMVDARDPAAIEEGFERLAEDADLRARLTMHACHRELRRWVDYGEAVARALCTAPALDRLVVIEGPQERAAAYDALVDSGTRIRHLHWRPDSQSLLPGHFGEAEQPQPGAGYLQGDWAILPEGAASTPQEAAMIIAIARTLGLKVALEAEAATAPALLAAADVALFPDELARSAALAAALRELPKTAMLRSRMRVGHGAAALAAIAADRARTAAAGSLQVPRRVYYWVGLTVTQPFNTGVQRVTRLLAAALERRGVEVVPVTWDEATKRMVHISPDQAEHLARWNGPIAAGSQALAEDLAGEWLLLPEITVPVVPPGSNVAELGRSLGMRVAAIFYDMIPHKMPEIYSSESLANMRAFWKTFHFVDVALPISWTAAADLARYMVGSDMRLPPLIPCPLAGDVGSIPRATTAASTRTPGEPLKLLAVGTWEPRKNYPRLLRALAMAQAHSKRQIHLTLVGQKVAYEDLNSEIEALANTASVALVGHVSDAELMQFYASSDATVFASWEEGFGLPVLESLWHGRPCLCHSGSAMAEVAAGPGTLGVDMLNEEAILAGLLRLACEPGLLEALGRGALQRPIRNWDEYADDVLCALARIGSPPGWPLPAIARHRPLLTCAITTYNRAPWLRHSLPRLLEATRPWRDVVEVVVCDNASTDDTPDVVAAFRGEAGFAAHRNAVNVGMLGNLGATARHSRGAFVWLLGDDDLLLTGAMENVLEGLAAHPEVEMAYMNYAYTHFDAPEQLADAEEIIAAATPIGAGGANRRVAALRDVAGLNENLFTAIYACAFRRDHALRAYQLDTRGSPFSSLATCVPSSVYALAALQDRPAWWVGEPAVVVNMNVSWLRWALLWHLERMPDLFEEAERRGIDPARLDRYRLQHLVEAELWVRAAYFEAEDAIRVNFSLARLIERCKHLPEFRTRHLQGVCRAYAEAWAAGRVVADAMPPEQLFEAYGIAGLLRMGEGDAPHPAAATQSRRSIVEL